MGAPGSASSRGGLPLDDPRLVAFLPMLYVAWADGDLSAEETRTICRRVAATPELDSDCSTALGRWLDPERPPSAARLQQLLATIRRAARPLDEAERLSLSDLGARLAAAGGVELGAAERRALAELETALGVTEAEAARRLLVAERPAAPPAEAAPHFDPAAMNRLLEPDHREVRRALRERIARWPLDRPHELDREAYRQWVLERTHELADAGIGALGMPREFGGAGDPGAFVAAFETLAHHDLSVLVKFGVQFGLFGGSILQLGTAGHHERYLRQVGTLELPGCFAMTETGHGSNVADIETTATFDGATGELVIETPHVGARKDYIGNAACHGRLATVFAQLRLPDPDTDGDGGSEGGGSEVEHGVHAFLVPIRDADGRPAPGVHIEDCGAKMGLEGVDNGRLGFDRVRIPRSDMLDRFGGVEADGSYSSPIVSPSKRFFTMLGTLVGGRVSVALAALSVAKTALAIAVRYGAERRQFAPEGRAETVLLDYLSHQRRLLPRLAATYGLNFALRDLARRYVAAEEGDRRRIEALAAGLKAMATWHATATVQVCRECCGGQGYLAENRFAALKADSDVFTTFEGDNTVLLQLLTKGLLTGYRRQFSEMDLIGMARYLAGELVTVATELNPVVTHNTDSEHLLGADFQRGALSWRADHSLATLARRLKRRIDGGMEAFDAVIECQDHVLATARSHVERLVLDRFCEAVENTRPSPETEALDELRSLFALHRIEGDRGWFQEHGYLAGSKAKAVRDLVNELCGRLRRQALPLVEAFEVPEACLAPIARDRKSGAAAGSE